MTITFIIIIITVLASLAAFRDVALFNKLIFWPYHMKGRPAQYYRFLTSGFIHADYNHLMFNMISLYFFGSAIEETMGDVGMIIVLYLTGIIVSSVPAFIKHINHNYYRSLGASGGVSALVFFTIYHSPWSKIGFLFLPPRLGIPSILFAVLYLAYSAWMNKKGMDNVGHDAHMTGAVYGFLFAVAIDPTHGMSFIDQLTHPVFW